MRLRKKPFGIPTIGLSLAVCSCLVACKKESADLPPQTTFDEKGMPQGDQAFTPPEIHRDRPIGLDTVGLPPSSPEPSAVAKPPVPDAKPAVPPAAPAAPLVATAPVAAAAVAKPAAKAPEEKAADPVLAKPVDGAVVPAASGDWVVQVNVHRSRAEAEAQVAKLAKDGIPGYAVAFQAGEEHLSGSYWRVRVGRFASRADAQKYGVSVLEPKGFKFWIDKKSNEAKQGT
jgi:cell division septation protein DedD